MAELADAKDLGSFTTGVQVQVLLPAGVFIHDMIEMDRIVDIGLWI